MNAVTTSLVDPQGRHFEYLRLSVTEACNYRCVYCLPNGFRSAPASPRALTVDEIGRLLAGMASLGVWKVRLTGGEPTLRADLTEIVARASSTPGIRKVALSTNGDRLQGLAAPLAAAGLSQVNVSIDHPDSFGFEQITGRARLAQVRAGVDSCLEAGLRVKVNVVRLRGVNDDALDAFIRWVRDTPVTVRFIELMQTAGREAFFESHHVSLDPVRERLLADGWRPVPRASADGPAVEYAHADFAGGFGLIAPYGPDFCAGCNRLRVTARGGLRLCLFGRGETTLRHLLVPEVPAALVAEHIRAALRGKPAGHRLHENDAGDTAHLAALGG